MNNFLKLKNISKSYKTEKTIKVLKGLSHNFEKGKIYSIMGPSCSGKSTLLNLISLIDKPSSGLIRFDNCEINFSEQGKNDIFRAKKIGIVYQQNNLLSDFTALENVYLSRLSIDNNKDKAVDVAKKIINSIGLLNRINHYPSQLSGGEMQRIAIARALVNEPEIILADELTGSLDQNTAKNVFKILYKLRNSTRLIIYATHNRFFANMADCKLELIDGKIKSSNGRN